MIVLAKQSNPKMDSMKRVVFLIQTRGVIYKLGVKEVSGSDGTRFKPNFFCWFSWESYCVFFPQKNIFFGPERLAFVLISLTFRTSGCSKISVIYWIFSHDTPTIKHQFIISSSLVCLVLLCLFPCPLFVSLCPHFVLFYGYLKIQFFTWCFF